MQMFRLSAMVTRRSNAVNHGEDECLIEEFQGDRNRKVQVRVFLVARYVVGELA